MQSKPNTAEFIFLIEALEDERSLEEYEKIKDTVEDYKKLNKTCDKVLERIKKRKSNK